MRISSKSIGFIAIVLVFSSVVVGLLYQVSTYKAQVESTRIENQQYREQIVQLEKSLNLYETKELRQNNLFIGNIDLPNKLRFIENENKLLLLPLEDSRALRYIEANTLAKVIDRAIIDNTTWIYVEIPVYDTTGNSKGWIKENDTFPYTKEKVHLVQSDILITAGAQVYETFKYEDMKNTTPETAMTGERGRFQERKEGYCRITLPGGRDVWGKESSILYPATE